MVVIMFEDNESISLCIVSLIWFCFLANINNNSSPLMVTLYAIKLGLHEVYLRIWVIRAKQRIIS